jgi:hypothetical protein
VRHITYTLPMAQCTIEKFFKELLGGSEVAAVLQRLDRLTQDEARMTAVQTLGVVHGLVGITKVVMEGAECLRDFVHRCFLSICSVRWRGING